MYQFETKRLNYCMESRGTKGSCTTSPPSSKISQEKDGHQRQRYRFWSFFSLPTKLWICLWNYTKSMLQICMQKRPKYSMNIFKSNAIFFLFSKSKKEMIWKIVLHRYTSFQNLQTLLHVRSVFIYWHSTSYAHSYWKNVNIEKTDGSISRKTAGSTCLTCTCWLHFAKIIQDIYISKLNSDIKI